MAKDVSIGKEKALRYQLQKLIENTLHEIKRIDEGYVFPTSLEIAKRKLLRFSFKLDDKGKEMLEAVAHKIKLIGPKNKRSSAHVKRILNDLAARYQLEQLKPYQPVIPKEKEAPKSLRDLISQRMKQASLVHDVKKLAREHPPKKIRF